MTWPTTAVGTTNTDASTDSPATARADILQAMQNVNSMMTHFGSAETALASAATTDLGGQTSNRQSLTGSATITSFGTNYGSGPIFVRIAAGAAPVFTQNATSLITPFGATFTGAAGDCFIAYPKATAGTADGWVMGNYQQASAAATRKAMGSTTVGDALFIAITQAAAKTALGLDRAINLSADTNLQTWADSLPVSGLYDVSLSVAQGALPIGGWYIELSRLSSDTVGNLYHKLVATSLSGPPGLVYYAVRTNGAWSAWVQAGGIGSGQTWQDMTASRAVSTTYYNTTGNPIMVSASWVPGSNITGYGLVQAVVNGITVWLNKVSHLTDTAYDPCAPFIVPPGGSYSITGSGVIGTLTYWSELR